MLSFFPLDVLDEIWHVIVSVSGGFLTCSYKSQSRVSSLNTGFQFTITGVLNMFLKTMIVDLKPIFEPETHD